MQNQVAAIIQGDQASFEALFSQLHEKLYFFILKKTNSSYIAEEAVQETFFKLWQYRHSLNEEIDISIQLFRIARTTLIDLLRKQSSLQQLQTSSRLNFRDGQNTTLEQLDAQELNNRLWGAIEKMPPVRKKVFILSRVKGLTYRQIADELSLSVKTVENHMAVAIKGLRNFIGLLTLLLTLLTKK